MPQIHHLQLKDLHIENGVISWGEFKMPCAVQPNAEHQEILNKKSLNVELSWTKVVLSDLQNLQRNLTWLEALYFYKKGLCISNGFRYGGCNIQSGYITDFSPINQKHLNDSLDAINVTIVLNDGFFFDEAYYLKMTS